MRQPLGGRPHGFCVEEKKFIFVMILSFILERGPRRQVTENWYIHTLVTRALGLP